MVRGDCNSNGKRFDVTTSTSVSSDSLVAAGCSTSTVTFAARDGQRLNVSIVDFTHTKSRDDVRSCLNYLEFKDVGTGDVTLVCAESERIRHVLTSSSSQLQAAFQLHDATKQRFLLQFDGNILTDVI